MTAVAMLLMLAVLAVIASMTFSRRGRCLKLTELPGVLFILLAGASRRRQLAAVLDHRRDDVRPEPSSDNPRPLAMPVGRTATGQKVYAGLFLPAQNTEATGDGVRQFDRVIAGLSADTVRAQAAVARSKVVLEAHAARVAGLPRREWVEGEGFR